MIYRFATILESSQIIVQRFWNRRKSSCNDFRIAAKRREGERRSTLPKNDAPRIEKAQRLWAFGLLRSGAHARTKKRVDTQKLLNRGGDESAITVGRTVADVIKC